MSFRVERLAARTLSRDCSSCLSGSIFGSTRSVPLLPEGINLMTSPVGLMIRAVFMSPLSSTVVSANRKVILPLTR